MTALIVGSPACRILAARGGPVPSDFFREGAGKRMIPSGYSCAVPVMIGVFNVCETFPDLLRAGFLLGSFPVSPWFTLEWFFRTGRKSSHGRECA